LPSPSPRSSPPATFDEVVARLEERESWLRGGQGVPGFDLGGCRLRAGLALAGGTAISTALSAGTALALGSGDSALAVAGVASLFVGLAASCLAARLMHGVSDRSNLQLAASGSTLVGGLSGIAMVGHPVRALAVSVTLGGLMAWGAARTLQTTHDGLEARLKAVRSTVERFREWQKAHRQVEEATGRG
jgi:hypothetical protein